MSETREAYDGAPIIPWDEGSQEPFRVGYLIGVEAALDALKDEKLPNLPGLTFAKCVVENMLNSERITRLSAAYRHAVKHGVDLNTHSVASGATGIHVRQLDLVEQSS